MRRQAFLGRIFNLDVSFSWEQEQHRILRTHLTNEEAQLQQRRYANDIDRIPGRIISASPRFIAEFRLADRQIVTADLLHETCSICVDSFQLNQYYAQWPCLARHTFHFDCMLETLRAGNACPLCRYPVEAADLLNTETAPRLCFGRMVLNIFI